MRKPIIAGNWKMHKTIPEAKALVNDLMSKLAEVDQVEVVFCPPFTALATVKELVSGTKFGVGAQNLFWKEQGAFTGEVSPLMLAELGCDYVIIGHSERRQYFGETNETVNQKVKAALAVGIKSIICVGESLEEREAGVTNSLLKTQTEAALAEIEASKIAEIVIAYEPIWAIGTGRSASANDANQAIGFIRQTVAGLYGAAVADTVRIQYGGSVKPENVKEYLSQPEIDGALVGGASLEAESFAKLVKY